MYAHGFRFYFTPLAGFLSPFPHGTGSLSVSREYLALEDGPPIFSQDITCPDLLFVDHLIRHFAYGAVTLSRSAFQRIPLQRFRLSSTGLLHFRSPLLTESHLISFPAVT